MSGTMHHYRIRVAEYATAGQVAQLSTQIKQRLAQAQSDLCGEFRCAIAALLLENERLLDRLQSGTTDKHQPTVTAIAPPKASAPSPLSMTTDGKTVVLGFSLKDSAWEFIHSIMRDSVAHEVSMKAGGWRLELERRIDGRWVVKKTVAVDTSGQKRPLLELLPAELRNYIYELVLAQPCAIVVAQKPHCGTIWMLKPQHNSHMLSLARVSEKVRSEALPLFFSSCVLRSFLGYALAKKTVVLAEYRGDVWCSDGMYVSEFFLSQLRLTKIPSRSLLPVTLFQT